MSIEDLVAKTETEEASIEAFHLPKHMKEASLVVQIRGKDRPVKATEFAKLIINTVKLLKAAGDEAAKEAGDNFDVDYAITEAAVIGQDASFTLMGHPTEVFRKRKDGAA